MYCKQSLSRYRILQSRVLCIVYKKKYNEFKQPNGK